MKKIAKKLFCCILPIALIVLAGIPSFAALEYVTSEITGNFDTLPPEYAGAKTVALTDFFEEGATNARSGTVVGTTGDTGEENEFNYVYLKADGLGDYTVPFTVENDGYYFFGFRLMGWTASVPRSTNIRIDDGPWVYIMRDYAEENQHHNDYWTGVSAILAKASTP